MSGDETTFFLRNIALAQLVLVAAAPESTLWFHRELQKLWKALSTPVRLPKKKSAKKTRFWEIDMTKFEP